MQTPWAILLCKFNDNDTEPFSFQFYENLFTQAGAGSQNMVDFFHDMSLGNVDLNGSQVFGWFTLNKKRSEYTGSGTNSPGRVELISWAKQAAAEGRGTHTDKVDLSQFFGIMVCMNVPTDLFGGPQGVVCDNSSMMPSLLGQEMGHRYGLDHSRSNDPSINPIDCLTPPPDYRDAWDIMSTACAFSASHRAYTLIGPSMNAWNRRSVGWLDESRVWKGESGEVELRPLIRPDLQGFLAAQVGEFLVEFRVKEGWDAGIPRAAILVHRFEDNHSYIMSGNNGSQDLIVGNVFQVGSQNNIFDLFLSVKVISIDPLARVARLSIQHRAPFRSPVLEGSVLVGLRGGGDGVVMLGGKLIHVSPGSPVMRILEQIAILETSQLVTTRDLSTSLQREALTTIARSVEKELGKLDSFREPAPFPQRQAQKERDF